MSEALWCPVCGSVHAGPRDCPGDLRATGPERHGWRVAVETPLGIEAYGILVAPTHERWRARILTFPNVLWTIPGGAATLKFVGRFKRFGSSASSNTLFASDVPGGPCQLPTSSFVPAKLIVPSALRGIGFAAKAPGSPDNCAPAGDNDSTAAATTAATSATTAQRLRADLLAIDATTPA